MCCNPKRLQHGSPLVCVRKISAIADLKQREQSNATMLQGLLDKLSPMSMMAEDGLQKATLAAKLLNDKADDPSTAAGIAEANGVLILLQTALLHPVPALREAATSVVTKCVKTNDAAFIEAALDKNLPVALVRLCAEQDRRAKVEEPEEGGEKAHDPDLPVRRIAVVCLEHLLLRVSAATTLRVLTSSEWEGVPGTCLMLLANTDASIRASGASLLRGLLALPVAEAKEAEATVSFSEDDGGNILQSLLSHCDASAEKAAGALACGASDDSPAVSHTALGVVRALMASEPLRKELRGLGASQAFADLGAEAADLAEWCGGIEAAAFGEAK